MGNMSAVGLAAMLAIKSGVLCLERRRKDIAPGYGRCSHAP